jgi:hypothetical protein
MSGLDCAHAFDLGEAFVPSALRLRSRTLLREPLRVALAEDRPSEPIEFLRAEGDRADDFVGTPNASIRLVSERFIAVLRGHRFTGWTTFLIRARLDERHALEGYAGLAVTGRCGPIDDALSEEIMISPRGPSGRPMPGLRGICWQPDTWDGSDIFAPEGSARICVVEDVKVALEHAGVTNVEFRQLSDVERQWRSTTSGPKVLND